MSDGAPEFAVIIPCHNEAAHLGEQLDALSGEAWSGSWEIVVVDNNSTDATGDIARSYQDALPHLRVIEAADGAGVAYARNAGARVTQARSIAFCDGDDVIQPGWVRAMAEALRRHVLVAGAVDTTLVNPSWLADARSSRGVARLPTLGSLTFARGNNCGMGRALFDELGGFDEDFVGLEDLEFSLRARRLGHEPFFVADAVVAYRFREDLKAVWKQGLYYGVGLPALELQARSMGLKGRGRFGGVRSWGWLIAHLPDLRRRPGQFAYLWVLAIRIGVIRGAIRERSFHV